MATAPRDEHCFALKLLKVPQHCLSCCTFTVLPAAAPLTPAAVLCCSRLCGRLLLLTLLFLALLLALLLLLQPLQECLPVCLSQHEGLTENRAVCWQACCCHSAAPMDELCCMGC